MSPNPTAVVPSLRRAVLEGGAALVPGGLADVGSLLARAARSGHGGVLWVGSDGSEEHESYADLEQRARRVAAGLAAAGCEPGAIVVVDAFTHRAVQGALWGCITGGFLPLPVPREGVLPLSALCSRLERAVVITERDDEAPLLRTKAGQPVRRLRLSALERHPTTAPRQQVAAGDPCLVLATSGTSTEPKLVVLTHDNVLTAIAGSAAALPTPLDASSLSVNWLPLAHVGGLLRSLRDVMLGCTQVQLATRAVLSDPQVWLAALERHRAVTTWAPAFAFGLLLRASRAGTPRRDLRSVRSFCTAGEPIVAETALRLFEVLAAGGLAVDAMHSAWGMTEAFSATFSATYLAELQAGARVPSVGRPIAGVEVRIVDDAGDVAPEGVTGHLQVRGRSCSARYLESGAEPTRAGWLRTGDLGTIADARLTVAGRSDDLIVVGGRKLMPSQVEAVVEPLATGRTVACAWPSEAETRLAVLFETDAEDDETLRASLIAVRGEVSRHTGVGASAAIPLPPGSIPTGAAGKVLRSEVLRDLLAGLHDERLARADRLLRAPGPGPAAEGSLGALRALLAEWLGLPDLGVDDDLFGLGVGSLELSALAARLSQLGGRPIAPLDVLCHSTARALAGHLLAAADPVAPAVERGARRGSARRTRVRPVRGVHRGQ